MSQATLQRPEEQTGRTGFTFAGTDEYEPRILELLNQRLITRAEGPYWPLTEDVVRERLGRLLAAHGLGVSTVSNLRRMAGGASKEQFSFDLTHPDGLAEPLVLRIDPRESIVETCRLREAEALQAFQGVVPIAPLRLVDGEGTWMGRPAVILGFVNGTTKPPIKQGRAVTGWEIARMMAG